MLGLFALLILVKHLAVPTQCRWGCTSSSLQQQMQFCAGPRTGVVAAAAPPTQLLLLHHDHYQPLLGQGAVGEAQARALLLCLRKFEPALLPLLSQPCRRLWLWLCDGLTVKDALVIAAWAAYNAVWYSIILTKAIAKADHRGGTISPRGVASTLASLMAPNLVPLLFPVSRWVGCWKWGRSVLIA